MEMCIRDSLKVVVTTTQLADFAAEVGGNDIELTGMLAPGSSAHHFDPTPADLLSLCLLYTSRCV